MSKKGITFVIILAVLIIGLSGLLVYRMFFYQKANNKPKEVKILDTISDYNYVLEDRDSKLYKTNFNKLKTVLSKKEVNEKEYARLLTTLFVIDFYSLDNKISKYDVGSLEFIAEDDITVFKHYAMTSHYKNVKDNSYGTRKQKLPKVESVNIINIEDTVYKDNEDSYLIDVSWLYDSDYDASNHANITLVKEDNKLIIVKVETIEENID